LFLDQLFTDFGRVKINLFKNGPSYSEAKLRGDLFNHLIKPGTNTHFFRVKIAEYLDVNELLSSCSLTHRLVWLNFNTSCITLKKLLQYSSNKSIVYGQSSKIDYKPSIPILGFQNNREL
jgi:hypothetical protein